MTHSVECEMLVCPRCGGTFVDAPGDAHGIDCVRCHQRFARDRGIPLLFWPNAWDGRADVTDIVKTFYEANPFPNYENIDSAFSLREKAERGVFARLLDEQIPPGAAILEVGCGTGQLANFLGTTPGRTVFGADICLHSLRLGQEFKERNQINSVSFVQMNLFKPVFRPECFDLVICNGVLHHTSNPFLGFQSIANLVKKGKFIMVGLYNTYGRTITDLRRLMFQLSGDRFKFLDARLLDPSVGATRRRTWFLDQYQHPHESKHTIGEVLGWFSRTGFEFVNSIPKARPFESFSATEKLFRVNPPGTAFDHALVQGGMMFSGAKEGGFFIMIGRRRP